MITNDEINSKLDKNSKICVVEKIFQLIIKK